MSNSVNPAPMVLVRGLPGSGKSTFAAEMYYWWSCRTIAHLTSSREMSPIDGVEVLESDDFFVGPGSMKYLFDEELLPLAHNWNLARAAMACRDYPHSVCVVANTFTRNDEMSRYVDIARKYGRDVVVVEIRAKHQNVHGVPDDVVDAMAARWEKCGIVGPNDFHEVNSDEDFNVVSNRIMREIEQKMTGESLDTDAGI